MRKKHFERGCRQKEIADHLGLHDTNVSNIVMENGVNKRPNPYSIFDNKTPVVPKGSDRLVFFRGPWIAPERPTLVYTTP
jgi:hypothetical protein